MLALVLLILAIVCFALATIRRPVRGLDLVAAGLLLLAIRELV